MFIRNFIWKCSISVLNFYVFQTGVDILTHFIFPNISAGSSPAEILGSNPTGGMDICLL